MELSQLSDLAVRVWQGLEVRIPTIQLDEFVIMPDHIHGIIVINEQLVGARREELAQSRSALLASSVTIYSELRRRAANVYSEYT